VDHKEEDELYSVKMEVSDPEVERESVVTPSRSKQERVKFKVVVVETAELPDPEVATPLKVSS